MDNREYLDTLLVCGLIDKDKFYAGLVENKVSVRSVLDLVNDKVSKTRLGDICCEIVKREKEDRKIKDCYDKLEKLLSTVINFKGLGYENVIDALFYDICISKDDMDVRGYIDYYKLVRVIDIGVEIVLDNEHYIVIKRFGKGFSLEKDCGEVVMSDIRAIIIKDNKYKIYKINDINIDDLDKLVEKKEYDMIYVGY